MALELNETAATIADVVVLLTQLTIEIISHATLTSRDADQVLTDISNTLLELSKKSKHERARLALGELARGLVATEAGA